MSHLYRSPPPSMAPDVYHPPVLPHHAAPSPLPPLPPHSYPGAASVISHPHAHDMPHLTIDTSMGFVGAPYTHGLVPLSSCAVHNPHPLQTSTPPEHRRRPGILPTHMRRIPPHPHHLQHPPHLPRHHHPQSHLPPQPQSSPLHAESFSSAPRGRDDNAKVDAVTCASASKKAEMRTRPRRPLTAYNLFFQMERQVILRSMSDPPSTVTERGEAKGCNHAVGATTSETLPPIPVVTPTSSKGGGGGASNLEGGESADASVDRRGDMAENAGGNKLDDGVPERYRGIPFPSGEAPRRKHRKSHGKIGFKELSQRISNRWAEADESTKAYFRARAARALSAYKEELRKFEAPLHEAAKKLTKASNAAAAAAATLRDGAGEGLISRCVSGSGMPGAVGETSPTAPGMQHRLNRSHVIPPPTPVTSHHREPQRPSLSHPPHSKTQHHPHCHRPSPHCVAPSPSEGSSATAAGRPSYPPSLTASCPSVPPLPRTGFVRQESGGAASVSQHMVKEMEARMIRWKRGGGGPPPPLVIVPPYPRVAPSIRARDVGLVSATTSMPKPRRQSMPPSSVAAPATTDATVASVIAPSPKAGRGKISPLDQLGFVCSIVKNEEQEKEMMTRREGVASGVKRKIKTAMSTPPSPEEGGVALPPSKRIHAPKHPVHPAADTQPPPPSRALHPQPRGAQQSPGFPHAPPSTAAAHHRHPYPQHPSYRLQPPPQYLHTSATNQQQPRSLSLATAVPPSSTRDPPSRYHSGVGADGVRGLTPHSATAAPAYAHHLFHTSPRGHHTHSGPLAPLAAGPGQHPPLTAEIDGPGSLRLPPTAGPRPVRAAPGPVPTALLRGYRRSPKPALAPPPLYHQQPPHFAHHRPPAPPPYQPGWA